MKNVQELYNFVVKYHAMYPLRIKDVMLCILPLHFGNDIQNCRCWIPSSTIQAGSQFLSYQMFVTASNVVRIAVVVYGVLPFKRIQFTALYVVQVMNCS